MYCLIEKFTRRLPKLSVDSSLDLPKTYRNYPPLRLKKKKLGEVLFYEKQNAHPSYALLQHSGLYENSYS